MSPLDYSTEQASLLEHLFLAAALIGTCIYGYWLAGKEDRQPKRYTYNRQTGKVKKDED